VRRKDKEITDKAEIEKIISSAKICRLAMVDNGEPYIVPLCFGYKKEIFYFHSSLQGRKIEILKKNSRVCFELDIDAKIVKGKEACKWGLHYKSVIGWGSAVLVTDPDQKREALDIIMAHYAEETGEVFTYSDSAIKNTSIIRVNVGFISGKKS
jgi:nitroimidazol reductase NimA-like FMN-containing flavoprotein (pyridoxamine 5'-phosphate oxidase superfamily)